MVRASDSQCRSRNCPGFILRHSGIWRAADEVVLNIVHKKKKIHKNPPFNKISARIFWEHTWSRKKISITEGNAQCRHLKKITCKGTLLQVFYLSETQNPIHCEKRWRKSSESRKDVTGPQYQGDEQNFQYPCRTFYFKCRTSSTESACFKSSTDSKKQRFLTILC